MLKGLDPLLNADVLRALRAMGHGDDLIIADTNFPSDSVARQTRLREIHAPAHGGGAGKDQRRDAGDRWRGGQ